MELLREIFLYSIESNEMKSGQLASVCRYWRSVITSIASLWSTLKVGTWTEMEQVAFWLQRAYPKKVIIDPQGDSLRPSKTPMFAALQNSLTSTGQWHELTISSFPTEHLASQLGLQVASPMNALKMLHVAAGCANSPSFAHLLNLVPTEAPLSELRLHALSASTHFLQPHWLPALVNLTVLIVSGKGTDEPFELLPTFTQLQIFEADRLRLPFYGPNTKLPLLCTLQKLQLRACSVQWMAGRQFPCLEECAILLPRHWELVQQHEVQLPSCKKLTYHGHPTTTARYFHVPNMTAMELKSHDCNEQRVYHHLRYLWRVDGRISKLTTLHLTLQCSEQVLIKVLRYLVPLQELSLSIAHPSLSWQHFLESLAAKPSTNEWPALSRWNYIDQLWNRWYFSQTWHTNMLPCLKYLSIRCPKGFSRSERLDNFPFLRLVGWTRSRLVPPLEHLKVWEGRGSVDDIAVDYTSLGYLNKHLGISSEEYDAAIVMAIATRCLIIHHNAPLFQLHSTALFRQLQHLDVNCHGNDEILILPCLEQIKSLKILRGIIPVYPLNLDLPLTHTLHCLQLHFSTSSWMLGRSFKALRECQIVWSPFAPENLYRYEGLQMDLPACTTFGLESCPMDYLRFFSCSNVQILRWSHAPVSATVDLATLSSLHDFLFNLSCLQQLHISTSPHSGLGSLIQVVFCDAQERGVWRDIRSAKVTVWFTGSSWSDQYHSFIQMVGHQLFYEKWWKEFTVTKEDRSQMAMVSASM